MWAKGLGPLRSVPGPKLANPSKPREREREREREMCVCWGGGEGGVRNPFILPKRTHLSLAYHDKMKKRPNLDLSLTK